MNAENFYLIASKKEYKGRINPFAVTCQTYLETGNYSSELAVKAYNFAGIKASGNWGGRTYAVVSMEYVNGNPIKKQSLFRKYSNADSFLDDYITTMLSKQRYSDVRKYGISNYFLYFYFIKEGGWATDPNYVKKLVDVSFKLAPSIFGSTWMNKVKSSWDYAKSLNVIKNNDLIKYVDEKIKNETNFPIPVIEIEKEEDKPEEEIKEEKEEIIIKEEPKNNNIKKSIIVIDAGHGGKDPGAVNKPYNINEKDIALKIAKKLKEKLENLNKYKIVMTRETDLYMTVNKKGEVANNVNADFLFSIHCDALDDKSVTGHSDLYFAKIDNKTNKVTYESNTSKKIAEKINKYFSSYFPSRRNKGINGRNLAVLRVPKCPAVLSEVEFISNNDTCINFLSNEIMQDKIAECYCVAIDDVMRNILKK